MSEARNLPAPCLVVLAGPGASGKSTWAQANFPAHTIVSSDDLRAVVGAGPDDLGASADAFAVLDDIVRLRVARRLTTVVDTLGTQTARRARWLALAREAGLPAILVVFDTPASVCRERNRGRARPLPAQVLAGQLRGWAATRQVLAGEPWDLVLEPEHVRAVPDTFVSAAAAATRQTREPTRLRFGLHLARYRPPGGTAATADWVRQIGAAAEQAGFDAVYVMDHFRQIPQVGRAWEDCLESYTTLAYLAACTDRVRLGALVTGITYRNVAHLGKIVATLDVLSAGRAVCGLGLAWFEQEHTAYGWAFPPRSERYALLEDALELLPLLWGPGSPSFAGRVLRVPEAVCYPRPLQEHIPLLVGGGGERRTLALAARLGDAANVFGDPSVVRHKREVLRGHCLRSGRDPDQVVLTHLSTVLVGTDDAHVADLVERSRPRGRSAATFAASVNAGTVADHVGRFRELAEAGAAEVMVQVADLSDPQSLEPIAKVISAFR